MTAPEHLTVTGPEDILGFIPHSLGYWPSNSLVAMTMQGKRLGATLRVDLPEAARWRGAGLKAFARSVRDYLEADQVADGTLLAIFFGPDARHDSAPDDKARHHSARDDKALHDSSRDDSDRPGGDGDGVAVADTQIVGGTDPAAVARLLRELEDALGKAGIPVRDAWLVGERYWRNAYCSDPSCCAPPGRPVEEIRNSRLNAELVFRGSSVGPAPGAAAPTASPEPVDAAVVAAEEGWAREFSGRWRDRAQFDAVLNVWELVLAPAAPRAFPADVSGYLRATLCVAAWRDAVLVMAAAGRTAAEAGAEEFGMFDGGGGSPAALTPLDGLQPPPFSVHVASEPKTGTAGRGGAEAKTGTAGSARAVGSADRRKPLTLRGSAGTPGYGDVLLGLAPAAPDWPRLAGLDRVLVGLGKCGGGEARAAALTARGWIEWCRGRGSFADALFTEAADEQPGYRLAELLAELVRRGTLCGWAARSDSAWQKFDPDAA